MLAVHQRMRPILKCLAGIQLRRLNDFINVTVFVSNLCWAPTCLSNETINKYRGKNLFVKDFRLFLSHLGD